MNHEITPRILSYIACQIADGRPLNAMLWANEYLEADSPLRLALRAKSEHRLESAKIGRTEKKHVKQILAGARSVELKGVRSRAFLYEPATSGSGRRLAVPIRTFATRREQLSLLRHTSSVKPVYRKWAPRLTNTGQ